MNPIYDQQITLEQALDLQNKIEKGEIPDMSACYRIDNRDIPVYSILDEGDLNTYNGGYYYLTRSDYATYIKGNKPVPDGYGYPNKELGSGVYDGLEFCLYNESKNEWIGVNMLFNYEQQFTVSNEIVFNWYAFKLTDLARVEAEAVVSKMERTEINAAQVEYLVKNEVKTKLFYQCGDEVVEQIRFWINDIEAAKNGTVFSLLTTDYNSLPDEFKALAEPKPSMPAHFEPDWKAKYIELEEQHNTLIKHLQEATASADAKQDIINNLEDKNKKLKFRLDNLHDFYHKIIWNLFGQLEK